MTVVMRLNTTKKTSDLEISPDNWAGAYLITQIPVKFQSFGSKLK